MLVALKKIEPYADGYKLHFNFGNSFNTTFANLKVTIKWGSRFDPKGQKTYQDWYAGLKQREETILEGILPGSWNRRSLVISPASKGETGYLEVSASADQVFLHGR